MYGEVPSVPVSAVSPSDPIIVMIISVSGSVCRLRLLHACTSLVPIAYHIFQHAQEKPGRPGQLGDLIVTCEFKA